MVTITCVIQHTLCVSQSPMCVQSLSLVVVMVKADGIGQQCTVTIGDHMSLSEEKRV